MNCPAASSGVSIAIFIIAPRGGELYLYPPLEGLPASGGFIRLRRVYPPQEGLSASGGLVRLRRTRPPPAD